MLPLSPPPDNTVDWALAEEVYRLSFPNDFKQFIGVYGNIIWCDLFRAIYPETQSRDMCEKSKEYVHEILAAIFSGELWDVDGNAINLLPYPSTGGLLPCLVDTNTSFICWITKGKPDEWTTVKCSSGTVCMYPFSLTELIINWLEQIPPADKVWSSYFFGPKKFGVAR